MYRYILGLKQQLFIFDIFQVNTKPEKLYYNEKCHSKCLHKNDL